MHPSSPHAPARLKAARSATGAKGRKAVTGSALDALAKEIHGKIVHGSPAAHAHVAADELTLRRPRRPAARRAGFRTPPVAR